MAVVRGYAQRWRIEEFHKTWKSGACNVEDTQLRRAIAVATRWIAELGGYIGKSSGGPPGSITIARDLERLAAAEILELPN